MRVSSKTIDVLSSYDVLNELMWDNPAPEEAPQEEQVEILPSTKELGYIPDLNPTQVDIYLSQKPFVLAYGERASGKTGGFLHKAIRHCYDEQDAWALLVTKISRQGESGLADELIRNYLPVWERDLGLVWRKFSINPTTKDLIGWIGNRHNGWSKIQMMSIPYAVQTAARMKGLSPSYIFVDELSEFDSKDVVTYSVQQVNRRSGIEGPQQWCTATNPTGDDTWVFDLYFYDSCDDNGEPLEDWDVFYVPFSENRHRVPEGYLKNLEQILRSDPIEKARLIDGKWIARPSNDAFFGKFLNEEFHIRGDKRTGAGIKPVPGYPVIVGMDPGTRWTSVVYTQRLPINGKKTWVVFDEIVYQQRHDYRTLAYHMCKTMDMWNDIVGEDLVYTHISDSSATTMWRPGEGTFDAKVIEDHSNGRIRIYGCPKGVGSVRQRITLLQDALIDEEIIFSIRVKNVILMLRGLEADDKDPNKPRRSKHLHNFDALTYILYYYSYNPDGSDLKPARLIRA